MSDEVHQTLQAMVTREMYLRQSSVAHRLFKVLDGALSSLPKKGGPEMTWPHEDGSCHFIHDNIRTVYGVDIGDELPTECTCGEPLTYADDLVYVSKPRTVVEFHEQSNDRHSLIFDRIKK